MSGKVEPSAGIRAAAHEIQEWFTALTIEGFTESQAIGLVGQILAAHIANGQSSD